MDAIDFSSLMLKKARKLNREYIKNNRVHLLEGEFGAFDFKGRSYSKIFAINVSYFWADLPTIFKKIHGLLKPQGLFVLYMSSPELLSKIPFIVGEVFNKYTINKVKADLLDAGFLSVDYETIIKNDCETYFISAQKQA